MKYIDTLAALQNKSLKSFLYKRKLKNATKTLINSTLAQIDYLSSCIKDNEAQIEIWNNLDPDKYQQQITAFNIVNGVMKVNAHLMLLECDFYVAHKYLVLAKDEWEYRFFARRIYTLMYETANGFSTVRGMIMKDLIGFVEESTMMPFRKELKKLTSFLESNKSKFGEIRNSGEAHKDPNIFRQIYAIENLSVEESLLLIQEYSCYIHNISISIMSIYNYLMKRLGEIIKD